MASVHGITLSALALQWDEVRISCQRKLEKNRFLLYFMKRFSQKISISKAFLEPWTALYTKNPNPPPQKTITIVSFWLIPWCFQTGKTVAKSTGIAWQKVDVRITFCKIVTFLYFICLKTSVFFRLLFSGYYLALFIFYLWIHKIF